MAIRSIRLNIILNSVRTLASLAFPLITFPYTSRILGPVGIGKINFANAFVQYFMTISALGIPLYGTREVARVKSNSVELNELIQELFILHFIASFFAFICYFIFIRFNNQTLSEYYLFSLFSSCILLNSVALNWMYQGLEEFAYITSMGILFSFLSIISIFIFVHRNSDYIAAAIIGIIGGFGSSLFNFWRAKKHIFSKRVHPWNFRKHIKPMGLTYLMDVIISCYLNLDVIMLGFLSTPNAVGYYSASMKLTKTILNVVNSAGAVFIPRLTTLLSEGSNNEYEIILKKSFSLITLLCLPAVCGLLVLRFDVIMIAAGGQFVDATNCLAITAPIILMIGLSNIPAFQILYPQGKIKQVIISVLVGAVSSFIINLLLIPRLAYFGAAIGTLAAESSALIMLIFFTKNIIIKVFPLKSSALHLISSMAMALLIWSLMHLIATPWMRLIICIPVGAISYGIFLYFLGEEFFLSNIYVIRNKISMNRAW